MLQLILSADGYINRTQEQLWKFLTSDRYFEGGKMICSQCGAHNPANAAFCTHCGNMDFQSTATPQVTPPSSQYEPGGNLRDVDTPPSNQSGHPSFTVQNVTPSYQPPPPIAVPATGGLAKTGKIMAIVIGCIVLVALIPCLGWMNWIVLSVGGITKIICWVGLFTEGRTNSKARTDAIIGLIVVSIALMIGFIRLVLGGGCL